MELSLADFKSNLQGFLEVSPYRIDFIAQFLEALVKRQTVNLSKLASFFKGYKSGGVKTESCYRRIQNFFSGFQFNQTDLARLIVSKLPKGKKLKLSLDRTNWNFGTKKINFLALGVQFHGQAIPLMCWELDKKANSNTQQRIAVIKSLLEVISLDQIEDFVADREFIGDDWMDFLIDKVVPFTIRLRSDLYFGRKQVCEFTDGIHERVEPDGKKIYLVVSGDWYILTNHSPDKAIQRYKERWKIETLFGFLKTKGFNLEDTHLKASHKLVTLLNLLSLALLFILQALEYLLLPKLKNHGYSQFSGFRRALNYVLLYAHSIFNSS